MTQEAPERAEESAPGALPADAPPMPSEPPTVGSEGQQEQAPDAANEELERLRAELAELKAANEKDAAERKHAEAIANETQRFQLPAGLLDSLSEFVPTDAIPGVAKAVAESIQRAARSTGVGSGGMTPRADNRKASWSGLFRASK